MIKFDDVLNITPEELLSALEDSCTYTIPKGVKTTRDLESAGVLLGILSNAYTQVDSLLTRTSLYTRNIKLACPVKPKAGASEDDTLKYERLKAESERMMARKTVLTDFSERLRKQHNTLSDMVRIRIEVDRRLNSET